jgi:hypothetical protein
MAVKSLCDVMINVFPLKDGAYFVITCCCLSLLFGFCHALFSRGRFIHMNIELALIGGNSCLVQMPWNVDPDVLVVTDACRKDERPSVDRWHSRLCHDRTVQKITESWVYKFIKRPRLSARFTDVSKECVWMCVFGVLNQLNSLAYRPSSLST